MFFLFLNCKRYQKRGGKMQYAILLISHSKQITDGLKAMIEDMANAERLVIHSLGGTETGELGSNPTKILDVVAAASPDTEFFVFADIGSAVLNAELAFDLIEEERKIHYHLVDAPLVEGAFAAAITATISEDSQQIIQEAKRSTKEGWD